MNCCAQEKLCGQIRLHRSNHSDRLRSRGPVLVGSQASYSLFLGNFRKLDCSRCSLQVKKELEKNLASQFFVFAKFATNLRNFSLKIRTEFLIVSSLIIHAERPMKRPSRALPNGPRAGNARQTADQIHTTSRRLHSRHQCLRCLIPGSEGANFSGGWRDTPRTRFFTGERQNDRGDLSSNTASS